MTNEKKNRGAGRGNYERDLLRKVICEYGAAWDQIRQQFDKLASGISHNPANKPIKIQPPNFVEIVLIPIVTRLAGMFPEYDIQIPAKGDAEPDEKGYFLVRIGEQVIIGIGFGGADAKHIKAMLFPNNRPWGNPLSVDSMENLKNIVEMVIQINATKKRVDR